VKSKASKTSPKRASSNVKGRCGPSFSLPHPPAKVSSLNAERPLSLGGANWSSCSICGTFGEAPFNPRMLLIKPEMRSHYTARQSHHSPRASVISVSGAAMRKDSQNPIVTPRDAACRTTIKLATEPSTVRLAAKVEAIATTAQLRCGSAW